jgi:hypothetical protein
MIPYCTMRSKLKDKTGNVHIKVVLTCVREAILAVEKQ